MPKIPGGLNARTTMVNLAGLILGVLVYFLILGLGSIYISNDYMSPESVSSRKADIHSEFAGFVNSRGLSGRNTSAVAQWTEQHDYVTIYIFETGRTNQSYSGGKSSTMGDMPRDYDSDVYGKLYPVRFADGIYHIAILDSSQNHQTMLLKITAFCCAALSFLLLNLLYTQRLANRIISLSKDAEAVSSGDLHRSIEPSGTDEIGKLALSMDEMRRSVIQRMSKETMAWQANSELITAISHDIRTPMTSLIGYLELLKDGGLEDSERAQQFSSSAYSKAMELKDLTDQLFRYFLVYGKAELEMEMESFDGRMLLEQLMAEAAFDLADAGFTLQSIDFEGECLIEADPSYLKRVMDNMVSNVKKYADREKAVVFMAELKDGKLSLCVSNHISRSMDRVESTKIGLRTCEKIMQAMHGSFSATNEDSCFAAEFSLPAKNIQQ